MGPLKDNFYGFFETLIFVFLAGIYCWSFLCDFLKTFCCFLLVVFGFLLLFSLFQNNICVYIRFIFYLHLCHHCSCVFSDFSFEEIAVFVTQLFLLHSCICLFRTFLSTQCWISLI